MSLMSPLDRLLQYGISSTLANKAVDAGLTSSKVRSLPQKDLTSKYGMEKREAAELKKCIARQPIDADVIRILLSAANHVCCVCKGTKGDGIILHHIVEYERTQDNRWSNLAVLCPNDHDRAHHGGLTIGLTADQIRHAKLQWERQVEVANAQKAARALEISDDAIDYVNVMRIEEMCLHHFGSVPKTSITDRLVRKGILGEDLCFDERSVRENISSGSYLFDYINSQETEHYRLLLKKLSLEIDFADLSEAARSGIRKLKALEGRYAFFIGGVSSKRPKRPIPHSQAFEWRYKTTKAQITWHGDAKYLMSSSSISRQGAVNRYIIYCMVRTVEKSKAGPVLVTCSPLLAAQPSAYIERKPMIAWERESYLYSGDDEEDDTDLLPGAKD
jgi:hypothetical protein